MVVASQDLNKRITDFCKYTKLFLLDSKKYLICEYYNIIKKIV